jgi:hypothetical protein
LNRGGEDLELVVTARYDGDQPPVDAEFEFACWVADGNGYSYRGDEPADDDDEGHKPAPFKVAYHTDFYEFGWEGTGEDVASETLGYPKQTVEEFLRKPENWSFVHKPGEPSKLEAECRVFCCGNAD